MANWLGLIYPLTTMNVSSIQGTFGNFALKIQLRTMFWCKEAMVHTTLRLTRMFPGLCHPQFSASSWRK